MITALILSGGSGTRAGTTVPKQYIEAGGRPVITYCLETLSQHDGIDAIQIVAAPCWQELLRNWIALYDRKHKFRGFSRPGVNRQLSIFHGLEDIRQDMPDSAGVLIHDAARPLLSGQLISACLKALTGHDGVLPVLPVKDTMYASTDGKTISSLLNRSEIFAGQAPELFRLGAYYKANLRLLPEQILTINGSTEPAILSGMDVAMIPGDENNFKITTKTDLKRFCDMMAEKA